MNVLHDANRACRACSMRDECDGPVPAEGPMDAEIALIGEAPGRGEDRSGRPWMGAAGQYLMSLLRSIGLSREDVFLSNIGKCRPKGNRTPTPEEAVFCASRWLDVELNMVKPRIIGLLGDVATSYFLGEGMMYERHGKPVFMDIGSRRRGPERDMGREVIGHGRRGDYETDSDDNLSGGTLDNGRGYRGQIVLPMYHPAAGLYDKGDRRLADILEDFKVLGQLVSGEWKPVVDEYPNPVYEEIEPEVERIVNQSVSIDMWEEVSCTRIDVGGEPGLTEAIDTEWVGGKLWSIQVSDAPGTGIFIPTETEYGEPFLNLWSPPEGKTVIVHSYMADGKMIDLPSSTKDTQLMAYLLNLPQGLKELAKRLCGMEMESYQEVTRKYGKDKAMAYLEAAVALHPDSPPTKAIRDKAEKKGETLVLDMWDSLEEIEDATWNKKNSRFELKKSKPQHIAVKMKKILADVRGGKENKDGPVDPYARWNKIDERERGVIEEVFGDMSEGNLSDAPREDAVFYSCRDADATGRIEPILWDSIITKGLLPVFMMDMATLPIALEMERNGIKIDSEKLKALGDRFVGMLQEKSEEIFLELKILCPVCAGVGDFYDASIRGCEACLGQGWKRFNPNSNKELATLFFTDLGFTPTKYTKTGEPSVAKGELAKIDHPVVDMIEEYRHVQHLKDSFCDTLPPKADAAGRVHPTIKTTRTATGRWSMEDPNCQQIPSRDEEGKKIREAFTAEEGNVLVSIDYSQIEMRVQAHLAQCKSMIDIFQSGRHIHRETCAEIYGIPLADVDQESPMYKATKNIGFGVMYLETETGLYTQMKREKAEGWDLARCRQFIKDWYKLRPEVWSWQQETIAFARRNGYVKSMMGRIREIPECMVPVEWIQSQGDRQAVNMPIQGSAQDILKQAMVKLYKDANFNFLKWVLQVHDELVWEMPSISVEPFLSQAIPIMEGIVRLSVPLEVEAKVGLNWGEMVRV